MELNQFALYSMNTGTTTNSIDRVDYIHTKLDRSNYEEAKNYLQKIFTEVQNPGDQQGFNFEKEKTGIIFQMTEDKTLIVMAKKHDKDELAWISLKIPDKIE